MLQKKLKLNKSNQNDFGFVDKLPRQLQKKYLYGFNK